MVMSLTSELMSGVNPFYVLPSPKETLSVMSQNDYIGKTLKPWPILVEHYTSMNKRITHMKNRKNKLLVVSDHEKFK